MATYTQISYVSAIPQELAARSNNQIAVFSNNTYRVNGKGETSEVKSDVYFIFYAKGTNQIIFRNDKKELLKASFTLNEGLNYLIPENKNQVKDYSFINVLIELCSQPNKLNVSLGMQWIMPILKIHNVIKMRSKGSCDVEIVNATISDWITIVKQESDNVRSEVVEKLVEILKLSTDDAKKLRDTCVQTTTTQSNTGKGKQAQTVTP